MMNIWKSNFNMMKEKQKTLQFYPKIQFRDTTLFGDRKNYVQLIKLKYVAMASSGFKAFESRIES